MTRSGTATFLFLAAGLLFVLLVGTAPVSAATRLPLRRVAQVRLPGGATRFDYQSVDAAGRRLYIAHLGDSAVLVVDLDTLHTVASGTVTVIATSPKEHVLGRAHLADSAHSVAVDPSSHRVYFPLENEHGHPVLRVMEPTR